MRRFFNLVLGAMAMVAVALISAFIAMRLAIHGREVKVPNLTHMTVAEASRRASSMGLQLRLENKFYSPNTPAGEVLAQFPAPGAVVRRNWPVRVTESLGTQQVSIPDLKGQGERAVSIHLKQLGLELGTVGQLASPDEPGVVVAQTPPANATGVDSPRVSVLLSVPSDDAEQAYVMPSLVGLSLAGAYARAMAAGLRVASIEDVTPASAVAAPVDAATPAATPATPSTATTTITQTAPAASTTGTVMAQTPPSGHRVVRGEIVRLSLTH
ncbi:PASTA domain-containing protein [Edaphobacter bradus]|uniref:PASTA domain-containing protein n=1 Tax=Edaphobacter bradus TaxID=2259016 RepID=UPI0021E08641|nr:PASTA domain-containing protein [Edaphobacter bradus]